MPIRFHFFDEMDEFLGSQPSNSSPHSIDVYRLLTEDTTTEKTSTIDHIEERADVDVTDENTTENILDRSTPRKRRRNATADYFKEKKQYILLKEHYLEQKMMQDKEDKERKYQLQVRTLNLEERKAKALEDLLKLKEKELNMTAHQK